MIDGKYKVKIIDLQDKYRFKIFCGYDDAGIKQDIEELQDEIDTINSNLALYSLITQTGYSVELELNNTNYQLSAKVKNKNGTVLSTSNIIDLPLESTIVDGRYDSATKSLVLILQNGNTITVPLADIISGLVDEETFENAIEEVNTTIENLDTKIEEEQSLQDQEIENLKTLRNILPKVSGSGESITLDNTGEVTLYDIDLYGNTSQETTTGKNLWGGFTFSKTNQGISFTANIDGSITANGTSTGVANSMVSSEATPYLKTLSAGTYIVSGGTSNVNAVVNNSTGTPLATDTGNGASFTLAEDTQVYARATIPSSGIQVNNVTIKVMLESGSTATSYEPYTYGASPNPDYPQPIHSVSGNNTINIVGRNLLSTSASATSETINGITLSTDGKGLYTASGKLTTASNTNKTFAIQPITLQAGTYYLHMRNTGTISTNVSIALRYGNNTIKYTTPSVANKIYEFTLTENTTINGIQLFVASGFGTSDTLNITFTPSIELTNEVTNYELYLGNTYPINLPSGMELNSIGDYKDRFIYTDKWYLHKVVNKVKITTGTYIVNASNENYAQFNITRTDQSVSSGSDAFNTYFKYYSGATSGNKSEPGFRIYQDTNNCIIVLSVPRSIVGTTNVKANFETWCSDKDVIQYYATTTPETIEITDTTLILQLNAIKNAMSKKGQTNISQVNNDLPFELDVIAFKDMSNL